ncbi:MAG: TIGR02281 family clan AA aspartic protease [Paracoccaceae bacterium]
MTGDDFGRLAYLILLGLAVGGYFVAQGRASLGKTAQQAAIWGVIFVGVIAGVGLWSDIRDDVMPRQSVISAGTIEVPRGPDGHYHLVLGLNGTPVPFVVDTGASGIVLTQEDAARVGIDLSRLVYAGSANTANGVVLTARARVNQMQLGEIVDRDVTVYVNQGEMDGSLLGMDYLQRFRRIEIADGKLVLTR